MTDPVERVARAWMEKTPHGSWNDATIAMQAAVIRSTRQVFEVLAEQGIDIAGLLDGTKTVIATEQRGVPGPEQYLAQPETAWPKFDSSKPMDERQK